MRCDYCGWNNPDGAERCVKCNQLLPEEMPEPEVAVEAPVQEVEEPKIYADPRATVVFQNSSVVEAPAENAVSDCFCPECGYPFSSADVTECVNCGFKLKPVEPAPAPVADVTPVVVPVATPEPAVAPKNNQMQQTVRDFGAYNQQTQATPAQAPIHAPAAEFKRTVMDTGRIVPSKREQMKQTVRDLNAIEIPQIKPQTVQVEEKHCLLPMENFDGKSEKIALEATTTLNRANVDPENPTIDASGHASLVEKDGEWYIKNISKSQHVYISTSREIKLEKGDIVVIGNKKFIFQ